MKNENKIYENFQTPKQIIRGKEGKHWNKRNLHLHNL